jgi:hypothetical protein
MLFDFLRGRFIRAMRRGITAGRAAVFKGAFVSDESARRAAHGGKIPSAMSAGFLVLSDFVAAVIAKKARFLTHFLSSGGGFCFAF